MTNASNRERIAAREAVVGDGLSIRRALPNPRHRLIGAWCFLDHAGPVSLADGPGMRVGPHPHMGLQTFTWQIEGETLHRDSLGSEQLIVPGQVNLMTAGRGISHSEESAAARRTNRLHLAQLWIALPDAQRWIEPAFAHHPELPVVGAGGFRATVLVGRAFDAISPVAVFSPLLGVDLACASNAQATLALDPSFEHGLLALEGEPAIDGEPLAPGTLVYLAPGAERVAIASAGAARLLLLGGAPFAEKPVLWWNFVARDQRELEVATADWNARRRFGDVRGFDGPRLVAPDVSALKLRV